MKRKIITYIIVGILLASGAGGLFYYLQASQTNYLIASVPYNGVYNLYFQRADSPTLSSVMDILGYWGDDRFSVSKLKEIFMVPVATTSPAIFTLYQPQTTLTLKNFFEANDYQVYRWSSSGSADGIKEIKKFVNPKDKIPVIVFQLRFPKADGAIAGFRVAIGVFDKDRKIVVHDHDLGNNYEFSYQDFNAMFTPSTAAILAVWPSDKLKTSLKVPDHSAAYPQRLESMSKTGLLLATKEAQASIYFRIKDYKTANDYIKAITDSPDFNYFPPAFQVEMLSALAHTYVYLGALDKAIAVMTGSVLPLNQNLNKPFEGWVVPTTEKFVYPYFILSQAYLKNGQRALALAIYKEMVKWREAIFKETGDQGLLNMKIAELEKELPSAK